MRGKRREGKGVASKSHGREERKTEVFERTKMCKFHILGICLRGTECKYAHHVSELQMPPDLYRTKMCTTLISQGTCTDPDCRYAHSKEELRSMPTLAKEAESSDTRSGLSNASTTSDNDTWKDPIKIELPMDMLSVQSTTASQSESTPLWDSSPETDNIGVATAWDDLTPQSVKNLPWQMQQVDETEEGSGLCEQSLWVNSLFEAEEEDTKCEESFLYNALFEGGDKMPATMPYGTPGFEPMPFMSQDFGTHGYPGMPPFLGNGYNNGMPWGWDSFSGFDLSSALSQTEGGFDVSGMQSNWQSPASRSKLMHDKTEPARVSITHTKI